MTILITMAVIILLLPFLVKLFVIYLGYVQWALKTSPIKIDLNFKKNQTTAKKKQQIGFPVELPEQIVEAKKHDKI